MRKTTGKDEGNTHEASCIFIGLLNSGYKFITNHFSPFLDSSGPSNTFRFSLLMNMSLRGNNNPKYQVKHRPKTAKKGQYNEE